MPSRYNICPFDDRGLKEMVDTHPGKRITHSVNQIKDHDDVYVMAHCHTGSMKIYDNSNHSMTADDLVRQLERDGLTKGLKKITIYACQAGAKSDSPFTFVEAVKSEFYRFGYKNLKVYGNVYKLTTNGPRGEKAKTDSGRIVALKNGKVKGKTDPGVVSTKRRHGRRH